MDRTPAFAGRFYPGESAQLDAIVRGFVEIPSEETPIRATGVVAPHAGYIFSGEVAGQTLARVEMSPTVLVLCPKHTRLGEHTSMLCGGTWSLPGRGMEIDEELAEHLFQRLPDVVEDAQAHIQEHAIEVILPFLRILREDVRFVPLAMGYRSFEDCQRMGEALGEALKAWGEPVLIVASSDMNHFEDQETTLWKDQMAIERTMDFDAKGLYETCRSYDITMCGVVPTCVMLIASQMLQASQTRLVAHTTSAEVSGDTQRVVGYAGMIVY